MSTDITTAAIHAAAQLSAVRASIDTEFGDGYAAANPELVAAMLQSAAIHTAVLSGQVATAEVCKTMLQLKPRLFG